MDDTSRLDHLDRLDRLDPGRWVRHFESNRLDRPEPDWARPLGEGGATAALLARSLSHFQLGESGDGSFLIGRARRQAGVDDRLVEALRLFVAEEQEHARLLARLVARFGGKLVAGHWTHACFRALRQALGLGFEIQTLLVAEIVGTAYYRLLQRHTGDAVLEEVCALMLADEARHLEFHGDHIAERQRGWGRARRWLWATQVRVMLGAAARAAWLDHRSALTAVGAEKGEFLAEVRREGAAVARRQAPLDSPP